MFNSSREKTAHSFFTSTTGVSIGLIILMPFAILMVNPLIPFANDHHCDPWYYFGLSHFYDQAPIVCSTADSLPYDRLRNPFGKRATSRVPAIWIGYALYHSIPPMYAHYSEFFLYCYMTMFSLFVALRLCFGERAAILGTLFMGGSAIFVGALATNYTSRAALAFASMALALVTRARYSERPGVAFCFVGASGAAFALACNSNLLVAPFFFVTPIFAVRETKTRTWASWENPGIVPLCFLHWICRMYLCAGLCQLLRF